MSSVYSTPEWAAWLASIREMPDDDNRRLFAADFLEDNGEGERAVLIRNMCEKHSRFVEFGSRDVSGGMWTWDSLKRSMPTWFKWKSTSRRVAKLALEGLHTTEWRSMSVRLHRGFVSRVSGPLGSLIGGVCRHCEGGYFGYPRSGVPDCPVCDATGCSTPGVLRELVKREPVAMVEVTDREAHQNSDGTCSWWRADEGDRPSSADLPVDLWKALHKPPQGFLAIPTSRYPTADAARAALSDAILRLVQPVEVPT